MAFIQITNAETFIKSSTINGWVITKVDGGKIFTTQETPFEKAFENGYLLITDIFGRTIYLNANQCIEMVKTAFTKIEYIDTMEWYEGTPEIRKGYSSSDDVLKPLSLKNISKICG
jgi:hypothetical protein